MSNLLNEYVVIQTSSSWQMWSSNWFSEQKIFQIEWSETNEVKTEKQELTHDLNLRVIKKQHIM